MIMNPRAHSISKRISEGKTLMSKDQVILFMYLCTCVWFCIYNILCMCLCVCMHRSVCVCCSCSCTRPHCLLIVFFCNSNVNEGCLQLHSGFLFWRVTEDTRGGEMAGQNPADFFFCWSIQRENSNVWKQLSLVQRPRELYGNVSLIH